MCQFLGCLLFGTVAISLLLLRLLDSPIVSFVGVRLPLCDTSMSLSICLSAHISFVGCGTVVMNTSLSIGFDIGRSPTSRKSDIVWHHSFSSSEDFESRMTGPEMTSEPTDVQLAAVSRCC